MQMPDLMVKEYDGARLTGLAHFAVSVGSKQEVIALTNRIREDGHKILSEPRTTGDGYFESVVCDPDGNSVEITI
jgi:lactoylglutathione lyase